jgi:putative peptidoglycan lipid II flippase
MFSMNNIFARAFYALGDIKTPMKISIFCLTLNLAFSLWLVHPYREAGLAVANTLSAAFNLGLLTFGLRRKLTRLGLTAVKQTLLILIPAAAFSGLIAYFCASFLEKRFGHQALPIKLAAVFLPVTLAGIVYWGLAYIANVPAAHEVAKPLLGRFTKPSD